MSFETFIARRYFSSGRFFVSVSTWFTIIGVTLGVAAVCIVTGVTNGLESAIRSRLLGTSSHISIFPYSQETISEYDELVHKLESVDNVIAASPFIFYKAAISSVSSGDGIIIRGIDPDLEKLTSNIERDIIAGSYSFESILIDGDSIPGIILGRGLADRLSVFLGDPLYLYSLKIEDLRKNIRPRVAEFQLAGIFETGLYEFDGQMAYISLTDAQDLFRTGDVVTGVHLKLTDIFLAETVAPKIDSLFEQRYDVVPWTVLHKNLFSWIAIEKLVLGIGFSLIVLVAAFSMISTLVMTAMEKRSEIGILKTMGATSKSILRIFVFKGLLIAMIGVLSGWLLAIFVGFIQNHFKVISLPPDIYFITHVPIISHLTDYLLAGGVTFVICFLASLYPAFQASRLSVVKVLRQ